MVTWDTSVSFTINRHCAHFIHSFHLRSCKARQASISSLSRFDSLCALTKEEEEEEERGEIAVSLSFFLLSKNYWWLNESYFYDHRFIEKKRRKRKLLTGPRSNKNYLHFCLLLCLDLILKCKRILPVERHEWTSINAYAHFPKGRHYSSYCISVLVHWLIFINRKIIFY